MNEVAVQSADGVILMPTDLCAVLAATGLDEKILTGLATALEAPLERMLEGSA